MNHWLFIVTHQKTDEGNLAAEQILEQRLADKFWGLGKTTPNRRALRRGDRVVFYVAYPSVVFAASATLASESFALTEEDKDKFGHGKQFYRPDHGVLLDNIERWETPRSARDLAPNLSFIENKQYWGTYFQGGVRLVPDGDYQIIVGNRIDLSPEIAGPILAARNEAQFALEAHLEEFIDKNWPHINFGATLAKYDVEDQSGRQYPAGPWSIDFLCVDKASGDFVVVELKRGKSSDSTVGQVLRYVGWVEENLAQAGQQARGIIIAQEIDDALKYAVRSLKNISVLTYKVDFKLMPFNG